MNVVTEKYDEEKELLTLCLSGRISSENAPAVQESIDTLVATHPASRIVLDAENLEYLSSVGLRIVLKLKKAHSELKIVNVSPDVYEIFDVTGFTEMMTIEKAYRRLSIEGCEVIGQGSNGKVYRLDADTIIKVYRNPDSLPDIQRERELARKAFVHGIPTAIPYDVVRVGDGYGSVFEMLNATSFQKLILKNPDSTDAVMERYVVLLHQIHDVVLQPNEIPDMKTVALGWADFLRAFLPGSAADKLCALVKAVPDGTHLLHGDYHVKNVLMQDGEVMLIDMDTLCEGDPIFEFGSIYLAYIGFGALRHEIVLDFMGLPFELTEKIWDKTIRLYFHTDDAEQLAAITDKAAVVAYTRLLRRTLRRTPDDAEMIDFCREHLLQSLAKVDTLTL